MITSLFPDTSLLSAIDFLFLDNLSLFYFTVYIILFILFFLFRCDLIKIYKKQNT